MRTPKGKVFGGVSRDLGAPVLNLSEEVDRTRLQTRGALGTTLGRSIEASPPVRNFDHFRELATDMLMSPTVQEAFDLNGSAGDHWDTHGNNFGRLKNTMLPTFDRAAAALIDDLAQRGRLDETLVVVLTEFGRTPKINGGAGRDHYPNCYSVVLAGGGIRGGQVYGSSDRIGAEPADRPCSPADLHATIFHALGIDRDTQLTDQFGRSFPLTDGQALPLF